MAVWRVCYLLLCLLVAAIVQGLSLRDLTPTIRMTFACTSRRSFGASVVSGLLSIPTYPQSSKAADLLFSTSSSGIQWADAKVGTGISPTVGATVNIDYVMSTTGARYGTKIYSTKDSDAPYTFTIGDGTTIVGLEQAISGTPSGDLPPMRPGGVRRVIIPPGLAYASLAKPLVGLQYQDCQEGKGVGPIPPVGDGTVGEYYQRFKNIYCNANRPYQPDLVMDIKLYGKR